MGSGLPVPFVFHSRGAWEPLPGEEICQSSISPLPPPFPGGLGLCIPGCFAGASAAPAAGGHGWSPRGLSGVSRVPPRAAACLSAPVPRFPRSGLLPGGRAVRRECQRCRGVSSQGGLPSHRLGWPTAGGGVPRGTFPHGGDGYQPLLPRGPCAEALPKLRQPAASRAVPLCYLPASARRPAPAAPTCRVTIRP